MNSLIGKQQTYDGSVGFRFVDLMTILYASFCVLELSSASFKYICLGLLAVWCITAMLADKHAFSVAINDPATMMLMAFSVLYFVYSAFVSGLVMGLKHVFTLIIAESPYLLFLFYKSGENRRRVPMLIPFAVFAVVVFLCCNILKLIAEDPNAARAMAADVNIYADYVTGGGYQPAYAIALLVPFMIKTFAERRYKLLTLLMMILFIYTLFNCGYTIAILIFFAELLFLLYWKDKDTSTQKAVKVLFFVVVLVLLIVFKNLVGRFFAEVVSPIFDGTFTERRMREFGELLQGVYDDYNGGVSRIHLYGISLKTFFQHPLIGISYKTAFSSTLEVNYQGEQFLGLHSTIIDGFARMGVLYGLYMAFFLKALSRINKRVGKGFWVVSVALVMLKTVNIATAFVFSFVVYFAIPILLDHSSEIGDNSIEIERRNR